MSGRMLVAAVALGAMAMTSVRAAEPDGSRQPAQDPTAPRPAQPTRPPPPPRQHLVLNTLDDIGMALETCWEGNLPPLAQARPGMMLTVMLTFKRNGEILGEPRFTFVTREAAPETRALYQRAVVAAIDTCSPLPFSDGLGNAMAGRPVTFPFVDRRNQKGA